VRGRLHYDFSAADHQAKVIFGGKQKRIARVPKTRVDETSKAGTHAQHGGSIEKLCPSVNYLTFGRQKI